jgi:SecD/SecF fusion protein
MKNKSGLILALILVASLGLGVLSALGIGQGKLMGYANIRQGLDLMGGVSILYEADVASPTAEEMNAAESLLRRRLDAKGWTEADVGRQGQKQLRVDIPGVDDPEQAVNEIGQTALLQFTDESGAVLLTGSDVANAYAGTAQTSQGGASSIVVHMEFTSEGSSLFAQATQANIGKPIYILLDGQIISQPTVNTTITDGRCYIEGGFTVETAQYLATLIKEGSLPFKLNILSVNNVGAQLGADALSTSVTAGIIGIALVLVFMLVVYRLSGLCADIALAVYTILVLLILSAFRLTLTLPGIAGIILSVGMAVDANVVIFERIREEVATGRRMRDALRAGYKRAFPAIVDSNVTTLIAGAVLFWLGTGPVKGFAQTLSIGILVSMFTCLVVTRWLMQCFIELNIGGANNAKLYGAVAKQVETADTEGAPRGLLNIIGNRFRFLIISACLLGLGLVFMLLNGLSGRGAFNFDVEFSGGTSFTVDIGQDFENVDIESIVSEVTGQNSPQVQRIVGTDQVMLKIRSIDSATRTALITGLSEKYGITEDAFSYSDISATVSADMQQAAILAVLVACLCMLVYVSWRFKDIRMGGSAILCLLHDALIVIGAYAILRIPLNYSFIAVVLTILGYSINATIIIFDRIRENRVRMRKATATELVDVSVSQTLRRSIYTSLTTLLAVLALYVLGVASIKDFTLPIIIGLLVGGFSSVCLAGSLWFMMGKGRKQ